MSSSIRVFVDTPAWFIRPKNTDWLYMRQMGALKRYLDVEISYACDARDIIEESAKYAFDRFRRPSSDGTAKLLRTGSFVDRCAGRADVVLCHRQFPQTTRKLPVVWEHCVLDPRMEMARGRTEEEIAQDYRDHEPVFRLAAAVHVVTIAEARRHAARFPSLAEKFHAVPLFAPYVEPIDEDDVVAKHQENGPLKVLFVGRQARRKGLDLLLEAVMRLPTGLRSQYRLDIVSSLSDGAVDLPAGLNVRVHRELPRPEVLRLMRAAHVFAMPSRFESFGLTFIEAMAAGCAVIGPDWEVQNEILDYGRAGLPVPPKVETVAAALTELVEHSTRRLDLAVAGHRRFVAIYSPAVVAKAYFNMFVAATTGAA